MSKHFDFIKRTRTALLYTTRLLVSTISGRTPLQLYAGSRCIPHVLFRLSLGEFNAIGSKRRGLVRYVPRGVPNAPVARRGVGDAERVEDDILAEADGDTGCGTSHRAFLSRGE